MKRNSLSSEEETDWKRKKEWVSKSKIKEVSSSSSDDVDDDEEDIDDDESLCRDEISNVMQKHGNQRRRLYTSSMVQFVFGYLTQYKCISLLPGTK